jgi:hypothetical protein
MSDWDEAFHWLLARWRTVRPAAGPDAPGELHDPQLQHRADRQALRARQRQLPVGDPLVDFTDPTNARKIAYADPAPLVDPDPPVGIELGGDWSTYWYNGRIHESDITRGLLVWKLSDPAVAGAKKFDFLNPQTAMTSVPIQGNRVRQ